MLLQVAVKAWITREHVSNSKKIPGDTRAFLPQALPANIISSPSHGEVCLEKNVNVK